MASYSSNKTCIQTANGGTTRLAIEAFHVVFVCSHLHVAFLEPLQANPPEKPVGQQQTSTIGCNLIWQANFYTVLW